MDLLLGQVTDDDPSRRLTIERQHRLALLLADTRTRLARLIGSLPVGSVLSHGAVSHLLGQLLARVSLTLRDIKLRVAGTSEAAEQGPSVPAFVFCVTCKAVSLTADAGRGEGGSSARGGGGGSSSKLRERMRILAVEGLSVHWWRCPYGGAISGSSSSSSSKERGGAGGGSVREEMAEEAHVVLESLNLNASLLLAQKPALTHQSTSPRPAQWLLTQVRPPPPPPSPPS